MTKLPKGSLKVIHINPAAIIENEERARGLVKPRRYVPVTTVHTSKGKKSVKTKGFGIRVTGKVSLSYEVTRFPLDPGYGHRNSRVWLETNDEVLIEDAPGEFNAADAAAQTEDKE